MDAGMRFVSNSRVRIWATQWLIYDRLQHDSVGVVGRWEEAEAGNVEGDGPCGGAVGAAETTER